jgi:transcriptional regulator with XRE-family HTH domain
MTKEQPQEREAGFMGLGRKIRELRKSLDMTQAELAETIGVDESYVSKIEKGRLSYTPSEETLRLIARTLKADPLEILAMAKKTPDELQMVAGSQHGARIF